MMERKRDVKGEFWKGVRHGMPIGLGYLSVSFGFGILAAQYGLSVLQATAISATNLTSAGQAAGVAIIAAGGTLVEMMLTQLIINLRYALMGISLSQRLDDSFTFPHRVIAAFGITDEIFAVSFSQPFRVKPRYMYGMILISFTGWVLGTLIGASAGYFLPVDVINAMGITLYGMFLAIIIPPAKKKRSVLFVILLTAAFSTCFHYLLPALTSGFVVIISAVVASVAAALLFPIKEKEGQA